MNPTIALVDDDPDLVRILGYHLSEWGYNVRPAASHGEFRQDLAKNSVDLVLLDLNLGAERGLDVLRELVRERFAAPVVILTAHASIQTAVQAIKLGAYDFITKPPDLQQLRIMLQLAIQRHHVKTRGGDFKPPQNCDTKRQPMLGDSPKMRRLRQTIAEVAPSNATVLILGESGTGKELVAHAIHQQSSRANNVFVPVNMAALPANLAESVLFGHEKGAFTGAETQQRGWCELAENGTLFLDEIGEMDFALQAKLLRFLQERQIQRVGSSRAINVDVRVVSATNRDPLELVREGRLREDFYYRLNVLPIEVPPLRERREDIPLLAKHFMHSVSEANGKRISSISGDVLDALQRYDWPGNVRQLENVMQRMVILSANGHIVRELLPVEILSQVPAGTVLETPAPVVKHDNLRPIDRLERQAIVDALESCRSNVVQAAELLGMAQATIYRKIKRYGIELKRWRRTSA